MKKYLSGIIAMSLLMGLAACSDDFDDIRAEVILPDAEVLTQLERWGYTVPFEIQSDSEWKIENDCRFLSFTPESGTGNATVEIFTRDNMSDERRTGEFRIVFPKNPKRNRTVKVEQKSTADYDENAGAVQGSQQWAVGYGYDLSGGYANASALRTAILNHKKLEDRIAFGASSMEIETETYTGSSITELSNDLNASAGFKGGAWGFSGEIKASFDYKTFNSSTHEYILNYHTIVISPVYLEGMNRSTIARGRYMWPDAYDAINGLDPYYSSTNEGFKRLLEDYGTHIVISAGLGGRVRQSTTVDISQITDAYDLDAYAAASYKGIVEADASVSDKFHQSFQNNQKYCKSKLSVWGGTEETQLELQGANGFTEANLKAWQKTVSSRPALVSMNANTDMLPLYEIVDINNYPERAEALKAFMTGEPIQEVCKPISMEYNTGTVTHFEVPTFDDSKQENSQIKKVYVGGGQLVAKVCREYIPVINQFSRVTVAYPVLNNKTRWNMGFFIGDAEHKPARVCWEGDKLTVSEYTGEEKGEMTHLYARGSSFSTSSTDEISEGRIMDETISAPGYKAPHDYPVVKIFDKIWMRENYQADATSYGMEVDFLINWTDKCEGDGLFYKCSHAQMVRFEPDGWRIAERKEYEGIKATLEANDVRHISVAQAFQPEAEGGILGFHHTNVGYMYRFRGYTDDGWHSETRAHEYGNLTRYGCPDDEAYFEINKTTFEVGRWQSYWHYVVRLVQDIQ